MEPEVIAISNDTGVLTGNNVTLECTVSSSDGMLNVNWSTPVQTAQPVNTMLDETTVLSSLSLTSVDSSYSGVYACVVLNRAGTVMDMVSVSVVSKYTSVGWHVY